MTTSKWNKFVLLMWKNWILQWRHKIQTAVEIFVPVLFSGLLVLIRSLVDPEVFNEPTIYDSIQLTDLDHLRLKNITKPSPIDFKLVYSPTNNILQSIVERASSFLNLTLPVESRENASELQSYLFQNNVVTGIEFDDSYSSLSSVPNAIKYALRFPSELRTSTDINPLIFNWRTDILFPIFQTGGPRNDNYTDGGLPSGYYPEGFLDIQNSLSKAFIELKTSTTGLPDIFINRYPYPPHTQDVLLQGLESFVSIIILLSFVYPCINLVKFIATEKEKQLKEAMKIMGLPNWLHWFAWFVKALIFMMISISLMVLLLKVSWYPDTNVSVLTFSEWSVLWVFLFIYSISTISYCFMMSVFFSKANTATAVTGLVWFIFYSPYTFTQQNYELLGLAEILLVSLFSNTAMAYGFQLILRYEGTGTGLQWNNVWVPVTPDDELTVGAMMMMLLFDAALYFLITLYVEKVKPGEFGVPEKWYFPFTKSFWCGATEYLGVGDISKNNQNQDNMEAEPIDKYAGVQVKDLRKVYSNKKVAVEGLSLNMYEDQITVLLGHNGAGKTTTMSMLTGMFPPTSGTALVNGKDIRMDIIGVRSSLGLCPQHNILFDELTVREHIIFYSKLKGLDNDEIEKEIVKYVDLLELNPKINSQACTLSGGMQRKLSVGVALCGKSKVVLCDEPTSGMDPAARRALWDLLQKEKAGRTILLSTHFMDEADILGDRIAIMSDGKLKACGSSFFLKKKFGVGYHLICVKGQECNVKATAHLLRKYVPDLVIETDVGSELSFELSEKYSDRFEIMLRDLEDHSNELGLLGYGVSLTTLEEVFMKVGTDDSNKEALDLEKANKNNQMIGNGMKNGITNGVGHDDPRIENDAFERDSTESITSDSESVPLLTGFFLLRNQCLAMLEKKFWYTVRNIVLYIIQIIIPMAFLILTILIVRTWAGGGDLPNLDIDFSKYRETTTVLETKFTAPGSSFARDVAREYESLFRTQASKDELQVIEEDFSSYILRMGENLQSRINQQYLTAATITDNFITAWFNNQPYHSAPLSLNLLHNAMLRASGCGADCKIEVSNKPIPYTTQSRMDMLQAGNNMGFQLAFNTGFALSFVSAFYVLFYIRERVGRAKLLQFVSGVNIYIFWITAFVWDFLTFVVTALFSMATLAAFQEDGFSTFAELGRVFIIWIIFGFGMLPLTYLMSMLFTIPSTGFVRIAIFNIFTGISLFSIVFIMAVPAFDLVDVANGLTWFFLLFPHFALSQGLNNLNIINTVYRTCDRGIANIPSWMTVCEVIPMCCERDYYQWEAPGIGRNITYMLLVGVGAFLLLLIIETRIIEALVYKGRSLYKGTKPPISEDGFLDEDVMAEKERVNNMEPLDIRQQNLVLRSMTKYYKKFLAVNQLTVAVNHSECFGLLGVNGAGKTSTFKMLTGDEKITSGQAWVKGTSLKDDMKKVHKDIGYCPQFDALLEDLTGRETLRIFCLLRGVPSSHVNLLSMKLAYELNFIKHIDKKVKEYSGGNKRKLSTAVALIGNPSVVYLDEPTTGMDPGAKRQLWNMVCRIRNAGKTIILTSHSMEECEALCTRLAIMVNGEFKCIGSTQYLKNKFSKGYLLTIKIKKNVDISDDNPNSMTLETNIERLKNYVISNFTGAYLKEAYQGLLTYYIPGTEQKWSRMFGVMEAGKEELNIEDYSLSQTSLEQVFLSFTKYQKDENIAT